MVVSWYSRTFKQLPEMVLRFLFPVQSSDSSRMSSVRCLQRKIIGISQKFVFIVIIHSNKFEPPENGTKHIGPNIRCDWFFLDLVKEHTSSKQAYFSKQTVLATTKGMFGSVLTFWTRNQHKMRARGSAACRQRALKINWKQVMKGYKN